MSSMARIPKLGQFGHTFKRYKKLVKTIEERTHDPGPGAITLWRNLSIFGCFPVIMLGIANVVMSHEGIQRPEYREYPYLKILRKRFPWRDGKRSLFHNPEVNWIPGEGYSDH